MRNVRKNFALARSERLLSEDVGAETVIFDEDSNQAHCLTPLASVVFACADGHTSSADLARVASSRLSEPVAEEQIQDALAQLDQRGLLAAPGPIRISRRDMVRKSAAVGASAMAATLIFTVEPPMAQAATCDGTQTCSRNSQCTNIAGCEGDRLCECRTVSGTGGRRACSCPDTSLDSTGTSTAPSSTAPPSPASTGTSTAPAP